MKAKAKQTAKELLSFRFVKEILVIYLFLILVIYPLYYENGFVGIGKAKWHFFRIVTYYINGRYFPIPSFLALLLIAFIWYQIDLIRTKQLSSFWKSNVTATDWFVLAYLIFALISSVLSPYTDFIIWGYQGWNMGIIAQFAFCALYFFVSRFWRWDTLMFILYLGASTIVNLLGVLNRFRIDPLGMYFDMSHKVIFEYLSTLGQRTWYSSYVMIVFPIGLFIYWEAEKKWVRIASLIYIIIGFMTAITQDADSAFLALFAALLTLFAFSFDTNKHMKRFLEIIAIMFLSWKIIGILQTAFPDNAVELGEFMMFGSKSPLMWIPTVFFILLCLVFTGLDKDGRINAPSLKPLRNAVLILTVIVLAAGVVYIILNTRGMLPENLRSDNHYLFFGDGWGNNRGLVWKTTADSVLQTALHDPVRFIFGCGPDAFYNTLYKYHADELNARYGKTIFICAHNEWLNAIVNIGITGGIAYLGIFVSAFVLFAKKVSKIPELAGPAMCIAAYFAHNFFCYQQIICTPIIFIIIGAGISIYRTGGLRAIYEDN